MRKRGNARAYQPLFGRFTRPDPMYGNVFEPQSWNAYGYVQNRPLVSTDPSGMSAFFIDISIFNPWQEIVNVVGRAPSEDDAELSRLRTNALYFSRFDEYAGFSSWGGSGGWSSSSKPDPDDTSGSQTQGTGTQPPTNAQVGAVDLLVSYRTFKDAVVDGAKTWNPLSVKKDKEYCFAVCQLAGGEYYNTWPVTDPFYSDRCAIQTCPGNFMFAGHVHTHGRWGQDGATVGAGEDTKPYPNAIVNWEGNIRVYFPGSTVPVTFCVGCAK